MNKLKELLNKIDEEKKVAELSLEEWDFRTKAGMEIRKRQAVENVNSLTNEYLKEFGKSVAKVFVSGRPEKIKVFSDLLVREGAFVVSSSSLYENIALSVEPMLSVGSVFSSAAFIRLADMTNTAAAQYGVYPKGELKEPTNICIDSFEKLTEVVRTTIRGAFGDDLNKIYLTNSILSNAIKSKFDKEVAVVVIPEVNQDDRNTLLESLFPGQPSFSLKIGKNEEPDKSMVMKTFRRISESLLKEGKNINNVTQETAEETTKVTEGR